jgi:biotin-(acetyl-CoA carboxylase) ligase
MAPASAKPTAADEPWLSLRRRHDVELRDFQRQVQEQKRTFLENVERARAATILAKHAEQEKLFWSKVNGSANNGANTSKTGV